MLTDLYLRTTDPKLELQEVFSSAIFPKLVFSVLFHTIVYSGAFNLLNYVFNGALLSSRVNTRLFVALLIIMFFGYFARLYHVKEIYRAYNGNMEKTRQHLDRLFIGWVFIG